LFLVYTNCIHCGIQCGISHVHILCFGHVDTCIALSFPCPYDFSTAFSGYPYAVFIHRHNIF
jgi:hypothetical protein